jgi:hypothetical protein
MAYDEITGLLGWQGLLKVAYGFCKEKPRPWRPGASKNQMRWHYFPEPARVAR